MVGCWSTFVTNAKGRRAEAAIFVASALAPSRDSPTVPPEKATDFRNQAMALPPSTDADRGPWTGRPVWESVAGTSNPQGLM